MRIAIIGNSLFAFSGGVFELNIDKIPGVKVAKMKIKIYVIIFLFFFFFIVGIVVLFVVGSVNMSSDGTHHLREEEGIIESEFQGSVQLSPEVLLYRDIVEKELKKYNMQEHVDVILAIMQVESGGRLRDIMQSSESIGLPVNTIQDPITSIQVGVQHYHNAYKRGQKNGVDTDTIIQSYNYGTGFVDYVARNGKIYSFEVAESFAKEKSGGVKVTYSNPIAVQKNGGWRYRYGNMFYVSLVKQYLLGGNEGVALDGDTFDSIMNEAKKFEGYPYTWGGVSPSTSFDCSGFTMWVYGEAGIKLPRTSYEQYNATKRINKDELKKGDLIFFKTASYNPVTHVGIYVGNNKMFDANNGGIGYSELNNYWTSKIVGYGRVK